MGGIHLIDQWPLSEQLRESFFVMCSKVTAAPMETKPTMVYSSESIIKQIKGELTEDTELPLPLHGLSPKNKDKTCARLIVACYRQFQELCCASLAATRKPNAPLSEAQYDFSKQSRHSPRFYSGGYISRSRRLVSNKP